MDSDTLDETRALLNRLSDSTQECDQLVAQTQFVIDESMLLLARLKREHPAL